MTIKDRQLMYRVRGPDGLWVKKSEVPKIIWVEEEHRATFWKKIHHLRSALAGGIFSNVNDPQGYLDGLPLESLQVYEFEVIVRRTGRRRRLTELHRFYEERPKEEKEESQ